MLTGFTPPAVKREPPEIKTEPMGPDTPWAMQAVTVEVKTEPTLLRVEPAHKPKVRYPWEPSQADQIKEPAVNQRKEPAAPKVNQPRRREPQHAPPRWDQRYQPPQEQQAAASPKEQRPASRRVSSANYAAVEAGLERYGLIDEGPQPGGRALLLHARKRCRPAFGLLNAVRPGTVLQVTRSGRAAGLRVRATTPARYYSPGSLVTTLEILVDEADWRSLAPRI